MSTVSKADGGYKLPALAGYCRYRKYLERLKASIHFVAELRKQEDSECLVT
jgi:hypothetical protein